MFFATEDPHVSIQEQLDENVIVGDRVVDPGRVDLDLDPTLKQKTGFIPNSGKTYLIRIRPLFIIIQFNECRYTLKLTYLVKTADAKPVSTGTITEPAVQIAVGVRLALPPPGRTKS